MYRRLGALAPKDPRAVHLVGVGLLAQGNRAEGRKERDGKIIEANPKNIGALMLTGGIHERRGDITRGQAAYERLLAVTPRFAPAANNLAWLLSEHGGDRERALQLAQAAKEAAPEEANISDTLGWILYRRGVHQRALALLRESAARLPGGLPGQGRGQADAGGAEVKAPPGPGFRLGPRGGALLGGRQLRGGRPLGPPPGCPLRMLASPGGAALVNRAPYRECAGQ